MPDSPTPDEIKQFFDRHPSLRSKRPPQNALENEQAWDTWRQEYAPSLSSDDIRFFQMKDTSSENSSDESSGEEKHTNDHGGHGKEERREQATKKGLEDDKRYQNIIKNTIEDWNTVHADQPELQIHGAVFVDDGYGRKVINPEVYKRLPNIHERAKDVLALGHGQAVVDYYNRAEIVRLYRDPRSDPAFQNLHVAINQITDSPDKAEHIEKAYDTFVKTYPEKAAHYRRVDAKIDAAVRRYEKRLKVETGRIHRFRTWTSTRRERRTVYRESSADPIVKKLDETIAKRVADGSDRSTVEKELLQEFVTKYKKKAQAYADERDDIKEALEKRRFSNRTRDGILQSRKDFKQWQQNIRNLPNRGLKNLKKRWANTTNRWENIKSFIHRDPTKDKRLSFLSLDDPSSKDYQKKLTDFITKNPGAAKRYESKDPRIKKARETLEKQEKDKKTLRKQAKQLSQKRGIFYRLRRFIRRDASLVADGLMFDSHAPVPDIPQDTTTAPAVSQAGKQLSSHPEQSITLERFERKRWHLRGRFRDWRMEKQQQLRDTFHRFFSALRSPQMRQTASRAASMAGKGLGSAGSRTLRRGINKLTRLASRPRIPLAGTSTGNITSIVGRQITNSVLRLLLPYIIGGLAAVIIVLFLIILFIFVIFGKDDETEQPDRQPPTQTNLTIEKIGQERVANGETITYTITVRGNTNQPFTVVDRIFGDAEFVSADPVPQDSDIIEQNGNLKSVTWRFGGGGSSSREVTSSALTFNQQAFSVEGFPPPTTPAALDGEAVQLWKSYYVSHAVRAAEIFGIDVGYVAFWPFFEGINFDLRFYNCNNQPFEQRWDPNYNCSSTNTQVGPGIRYIDLPLTAMRDAFDVMYGNHDPETIQRVGQQVIENIESRHGVRVTDPGTSFPRLTIEQLMDHTNETNRRWFVHLTRDDAISMYYLARTFKGHLDSGRLADIMVNGWGDREHYAPQRVINYIKAIYDAGISEDGSPPPPNSQPPISGDRTIELIIRPRVTNSYLYNIAEISR